MIQGKSDDKIVRETAKGNSLFKIISHKQSPQPLSKTPFLTTEATSLAISKGSSKVISGPKHPKKPLRWSENDSKTFFTCLEIFGMDFSMIKEILSHKTQRQILRKFHKEKKRSPDQIESALKIHESNLEDKEKRCQNFLEKILKQTLASEFTVENPSDESLDKAVKTKLQLMVHDSSNDHNGTSDGPFIQPLEFYLNE